MRQFNWRTASIVALTSSMFGIYSVASAAANNSDNKSGSSQNSASNASGQGQNQNQASNSNNKNSNSDNTSNTSQSNSTQGSRDSKNQSNQGQSNSSNENASTQNPDSTRRSSSTSQDRSTSRERDSRDAANGDRDDRSSTRDRSNRDYDRRDLDRDRKDDRNGDNRTSRSDGDRDSSRDHSSRGGDMRGPDIGIWFSRSSRDGLVISDVSSRGPIAKLGFREGDRIVSVNGHRVTREGDFIKYLLYSDSRRVTVIVLRDNREETIYVEPVVLTNEYESAEVDPLERFGLLVDDRYDDRIVVWRVTPRSPAYYAGFRPGDVIVKFGDHPYRTRTEFERGSRDWKSGDVNVQIRRGDRTRDMSVEIPNSARSDQRTGDRSVVREERTAQHDSDTSDQRTTDQADRSTDKNQSTNNSQRDNNNRGGVLNNLRGRGSR